MTTPDTEPLSKENLLWEPWLVPHYLARDERYARLRESSLTGLPTLSAQAYAEVLVGLRLRRLSPDKMALNLEEIDVFRVVALDRTLADIYGQVHPLCLASARNRDQGEPENWFVWNVALHRLHGCRILTNDRARYAGLVAPDAFA